MFRKLNFKSNKQEGSIIIIGIIFMSILLMMTAAIWGYTSLHAKASRQSILKSQALHIAEGGLDKAISQLNLDQSYNGESNTAAGAGTFTTSVASINANSKQITSTAYIPNSTNPKEEVTVKMNVSINLASIAFNFGVQVGAAGLQMDNNSVINGNVYSNGNVGGSNGTVTGDVTVAGGGAAAADQLCEDFVNNFSMNQNDRRDLAQKFTPSVSGPLTKASTYLRKTGTPGNVTIRIVTNNGSQPSKTQIGGSGTINSSNVTGTYGWIDASFSTAPQLNAGTAYWIILDSSSTNTAYYTWGQDANGTCYGDTGTYSANWSQNPNPTWVNTSRDFNFRTFMGGVPTVLSNITVNGNARANTLQGCNVAGAAFFQTNNGCNITGAQNPGTADSPPAAMPISQAQIDEWKDVADSGGIESGDYTVNGAITMGPRKIAGDLIINGTLYISGPIWVEGDITISNNASVIVDASVGASGTVLLADNPANPSGSGLVSISNNVIINGNNFPNSFPMILTTKTGNAMSISNNAAGAIFYAANGTIEVFNNAGGSQVTGYGIHLNNNAVVTYSTGLQSATFANGPGGSWALVPGTYVILY